MKLSLINYIIFYIFIVRIRAGHFYSTYREEGVLSLLSPPSSHFNIKSCILITLSFSLYSFPRTCLRETLQLKNLTNSLSKVVNVYLYRVLVFVNTNKLRMINHPYLISVLDKFLYQYSTEKSTTKYNKSHNTLYLIHLTQNIL